MKVAIRIMDAVVSRYCKRHQYDKLRNPAEGDKSDTGKKMLTKEECFSIFNKEIQSIIDGATRIDCC